jgi:DNA-binding transcriptional MerR regulator
MPAKQTSIDFDFSESESETRSERKLVPPPPAAIHEEPIEVEVHASKPISTNDQAIEKIKSTRGRMKISEMASTLDRIEIPSDEILFSKSYYSIGAVTEMFKVNHSLIRFWENEFDILKPKKNGKGDRFFRPEDIKNLKLIYSLLRERKFTIDGAKEFLKKNKHAEKKFELIESMKNLQAFLHELKTGL